ncbi:MAG TPA: CheR family methyltransferase, partial [Nitriliruptorales bacterium]
MNGADAVAPDIAGVSAWLARLAGLSTGDERSDRTARAIRESMVRTGVEGRAYRELLERDPVAFQDLIDRVTVGETHFFRQAGHFELLRRRILPGLLRDRPASHRLQLWSAGCATGEEAYSIAIVLEELGLSDRSDVLGTDISTSALHRARQASYRPWSLRGVDEARRRRYFRAGGERFDLDPWLVEQVTFQPLNLIADPYPPPPPPP